MTTPAVLRNVTSNLPWSMKAWNGTASSGNLAGVFDYEERPASSNCGRIRGFKLCDGFYHKGMFIKHLDASETYHPDGNPAHTITYSGNIWNGVPPVPVAPSSNMINASLTKALLKLKQQDFHLGNFLAEAHKTVEMVGHNARSIANQVLAFRRKYPDLWDKVRQIETGNLPRWRWCEIPNKWLELQYGWKPLMSDIFGAMQHLQKRNKRFNIPFVFVSADVSDTVLLTSTASSRIGNTSTCYWQNDRKVQTFLTYGLTTPVLAELSSLGLINPLEIVWEVTRYSFVVDWFLPIGSWLSALTADIGYQFITGGYSTKTKVSFSGSSVTGTVAHVDYVSPARYSGTRQEFRRSCYASSPSPGLYVKNPLSLTHVANALSLLVQAFK